MQVEVRLGPDPTLEFRTAIRRGLAEAGREVLAASDVLAPREPEPRHGYHMIDTGFVRVEPGVASDAVIIGYTAFWAAWQHEHLEWHHPNGGQAKFLETALLGGREVALETIAANVRAVLEA